MYILRFCLKQARSWFLDRRPFQAHTVSCFFLEVEAAAGHFIGLARWLSRASANSWRLSGSNFIIRLSKLWWSIAGEACPRFNV